jgi:hypothetical protein
MIDQDVLQTPGVVDFVKHDGCGVILYVGSVPADMLDMQGDGVLVGRADPATQYVCNGVITDYTAAELAARAGLQPGQLWQMPQRIVVDMRTLADARAQAWTRIKAARDSAQAAPFACAGRIYQADAASINDAALRSMQDPGFCVQWRLLDNSLVLLTSADIQGVSAALYARNATVRGLGDELRARIDQCASVAAVDAVVWPV